MPNIYTAGTSLSALTPFLLHPYIYWPDSDPDYVKNTTKQQVLSQYRLHLQTTSNVWMGFSDGALAHSFTTYNCPSAQSQCLIRTRFLSAEFNSLLASQFSTKFYSQGWRELQEQTTGAIVEEKNNGENHLPPSTCGKAQQNLAHYLYWCKTLYILLINTTIINKWDSYSGHQQIP